MNTHVEKLKSMAPPKGMDFHIGRRGHPAGCQIAAEFHYPDDHFLETCWGVDQVGSNQRVRPSNEWHRVKSSEEAVAHPVPGQDAPIPR